ncbi:Pentapeptide_repeats-containing protein [Hexamita inflata]|uniref:Pentapeptide repeats-containing protein n=1 Tax=Hexamita inflata TaxID=28002 RepID=A0AA86UNU4_9EUKA|nr:Pentapeptide repeats-containing protein [Hexamita inflata]
MGACWSCLISSCHKVIIVVPTIEEDEKIGKLVQNIVKTQKINMSDIKQLQELLSENKIYSRNPVQLFTDIMLFLSSSEIQDIEAWKKREVAEVAEKMIHRVYLVNRQGGVIVTQEIKDEWLKEILEIQKQINNSVIHQNGLEFELDCMRACINVLSIGKHDIKDEILNTISEIIKASISAIKADFSGLINLAKKLFDLILLNGSDKIKEFWYLKVMAISYTYGLSATNQEMLDKIVKLVNDSMKGNWHVCYAGLHSISKAFEKNTLDLGEALKVIEKFSTFKYLCNSWRLREKVALICIQQSTNSRYKDEFAKILRNMNRTETKSEVLKTLQNPEYLLSIRESIQVKEQNSEKQSLLKNEEYTQQSSPNLHNSKILDIIKQNIEQQTQNQPYAALRCSSSEYPDLRDYIVNFIQCGKRILLVSGPQHCGKSNFSKHLQYSVLKLDLVPIYVDLAEIRTKSYLRETLSEMDIQDDLKPNQFVVIVDNFEQIQIQNAGQFEENGAKIVVFAENGFEIGNVFENAEKVSIL